MLCKSAYWLRQLTEYQLIWQSFPIESFTFIALASEKHSSVEYSSDKQNGITPEIDVCPDFTFTVLSAGLSALLFLFSLQKHHIKHLMMKLFAFKIMLA